MASGPRRTARGGPSSAGRLHLRAIRELPSGHDAEIASIFRDMRQATGLTLAETARRLKTGPRTIEALEEGTLLALPEWPETSRVVLGYAGFLKLDARPILRRIHAQLVPQGPLQDRAGQNSAPTPPPPDRAAPPPRSKPPAAVAAPAPKREERAPSGLRFGGLAKWGVLLAILGVAAYGLTVTLERPQSMLVLIDSMPDPLPRLARAGIELLKPAEDRSFGQADPRARKADKLTPEAEPQSIR